MALSHENKTIIESYVNDKIKGLSIPIDMFGEILSRFNVQKVDLFYKTKAPTAIIRPIRGGFIIETRVPPGRKHAIKYLIAHELIHTFFYRFIGPNESPIHYRQPFEEELCDFGARAILIPRCAIPQDIGENLSVGLILDLCSSLDVKPKWLMVRLINDLEMLNCSLLIYRCLEGHYELGEKYNSREININRSGLSNIRKLIRETSSDKNITVDSQYLGSQESKKYFTIEIVKKTIDFFKEIYYILVKNK